LTPTGEEVVIETPKGLDDHFRRLVKGKGEVGGKEFLSLSWTRGRSPNF